MSESEDDESDSITDMSEVDDEHKAIVRADEPDEIGIVDEETEFAYVEAEGEFRIYAEDASDEQWIQIESDDSTEVEK